MSAADADETAAADLVFVLMSSVLVFLMQAGFGVLEAGAVRPKNSVSILLKNVVDTCLSALSFACVGFGLAFGGGGSPLFGADSFFLDFEGRYSQFLFQACFAATSGTVVSGAMAERSQLRGYVLSSVALVGVVYPLVARWVWHADGLLSHDVAGSGLPVIDFAGSGVVHVTGGAAGLCGAAWTGARLGRFDAEQALEGAAAGAWANLRQLCSRDAGVRRRKRERDRLLLLADSPFRESSMSNVMLGVLLLWVGWFGFNGGSAMSVADAGAVERAMLNTLLAPAVAGLTAVAWASFRRGRTVATAALNGILTGLVAITAGCATTPVPLGLLVGAAAGVAYPEAARLLVRLRVDDPLEAAAVHLGGGTLGLLSAGLLFDAGHFEDVYGVPAGARGAQVGVQLLGVLAILAFVAASMSLVFWALQRRRWLRMAYSRELYGMDIALDVAASPEMLRASSLVSETRCILQSFILLAPKELSCVAELRSLQGGFIVLQRFLTRRNDFRVTRLTEHNVPASPTKKAKNRAKASTDDPGHALRHEGSSKARAVVAEAVVDESAPAGAESADSVISDTFAFINWTAVLSPILDPLSEHLDAVVARRARRMGIRGRQMWLPVQLPRGLGVSSRRVEVRAAGGDDQSRTARVQPAVLDRGVEIVLDEGTFECHPDAALLMRCEALLGRAMAELGAVFDEHCSAMRFLRAASRLLKVSSHDVTVFYLGEPANMVTTIVQPGPGEWSSCAFRSYMARPISSASASASSDVDAEQPARDYADRASAAVADMPLSPAASSAAVTPAATPPPPVGTRAAVSSAASGRVRDSPSAVRRNSRSVPPPANVVREPSLMIDSAAVQQRLLPRHQRERQKQAIVFKSSFVTFSRR